MAGRAGWLARVGWLAAFLGPPVVAAGVWRQYSVQHPVAAVVIGVVYEAGVAVVGFFAGVMGVICPEALAGAACGPAGLGAAVAGFGV